jgi:hypothetical protein
MKAKTGLLTTAFIILLAVCAYLILFETKPDSQGTSGTSLSRQNKEIALLRSVNSGKDKDTTRNTSALTPKAKDPDKNQPEPNDKLTFEASPQNLRKKPAVTKKTPDGKKDGKRPKGHKKFSNAHQRQQEAQARKKNVYLEPKTLTITGRFIDEHGAPIGGVKLNFIGSKKYPLTGGTGATVTDAKGQFGLTATLTRFLISIKSPDGLENKELLVPWTESGSIDLGDLTLRATSPVTGIVVNPGDQAVAAAKVKLYTRSEFDKLVRNQNAAYAQDLGQITAETSANELGEFLIKAPPGQYLLLATGANFRESQVVEIGQSSDKLTGITLKLRPGHELTVEVKNSMDEAMANAIVRLAKYGKIYNANWKNKWIAEVKTNDEGKAILPNLDLRRYQVMAFVDGYAPKTHNINLNLDQPSSILPLIVQTSTTVIGQLMAKDAPDGMRGTALLYAEGPDGRIDTQRIFSHVPVPKTGKLNLGELSNGRYVLAIFARNHFPLRMNIDLKEDEKEKDLGNLEMKVLGSAVVTVFDFAGRTVPGLSLSQSPSDYDGLVDVKSAGGKGVTDTEGQFTAINLPRGQTTLTILSASGAVLGFHPADITDETPIAITLPQVYSSLKGQIKDQQGQVGVGVRLELLRSGGHVKPITAELQEEGRFEIKKAPPGQYNAFLYLPGRQIGVAAGQLTLVGGENPDKDILLPAVKTD